MVHSNRDNTPCILVVGDMEATGSFVKRVLKAEGYDVLMVRNSIEALTLAIDFPGGIDLLVVDNKVKKFHNGSELATCFSILRPETQVVLVADGDFPEGPQSIPGMDPSWELLPRAFTRDQLLDVVENAVIQLVV